MYDERPLSIALIKYCIYGVILFPELYHTFITKLKALPDFGGSMPNADNAFRGRITNACTIKFDPRPKPLESYEKLKSPWPRVQFKRVLGTLRYRSGQFL